MSGQGRPLLSWLVVEHSIMLERKLDEYVWHSELSGLSRKVSLRYASALRRHTGNIEAGFPGNQGVEVLS